MKKLSISEISEGELAMRDLCEKAYEFYRGTDPLTVALCYDGTFSLRGFINEDGLTFQQVEQSFVELAEQNDEALREYEEE